MPLHIYCPAASAPAYQAAAEAFQSLWQAVTGELLPLVSTDNGRSDLILIGSDAVNDAVMHEVLELRLRALPLRYGTDDYVLQSHTLPGDRRALILAGGRGRSTLYAVYHYFEAFAGCRYFWDGDIIPHKDSLPLEGIYVAESPRFAFRGLRYFAHRGLHRYQAEHWSLSDWKRELDWMVKRRLNFFMLRIGMDDLWQRAFPEEVPYPAEYRTVEGIDAEGYNDRSDFWSLRHRGKLREDILAYARDLDLDYPVDCGTMTHWYSRTPESFLEARKPEFLTQEVAHYTASDTGKVFDFTKPGGMDVYMHLTETMVKEHEKRSDLFHTIGLGERLLYRDRNKNFALKQMAYRRIAEEVRKRWPDSRLMLASWDFLGLWSPEEIRALVAELDPARTMILDYTSEGNDPDCSFLNWGVVGKFPWIFGLFHAYESESELRGPYKLADARLRVAAEDPYCEGMVLWPELSHSDPLVLEYLAENSWSPLARSIEEIAARFCASRYGEYAEGMNAVWQGMLPFIMQGSWGGNTHRPPEDEKFAEYCPEWYLHQDIWCRPITLLLKKRYEKPGFLENLALRTKAALPELAAVRAALRTLAGMPEALCTPFILRDSLDLCRTAVGRFLNFLTAAAYAARQDSARLSSIRTRFDALMAVMSDLLSLHEDHSLLATLRRTEATAPTNPAFEVTLKRNIANDYCTQPACELMSAIFIPEAKAYFDWLAAGKTDPEPLRPLRDGLYEAFYQTPLAALQPQSVPAPAAVIAAAVRTLEGLEEVF